METDIPHAILVDNVDNFVYNSFLWVFLRFQNVENFYTFFCVIHIIPHYTTDFVHIAKLLTNFVKTRQKYNLKSFDSRINSP